MANDAEKINRAIRACIRQCFGSTDILAKLAKFLDSLQQDSQWKKSEVRLVEAGVRHMLKGMLAEDTPSATGESPARKTA